MVFVNMILCYICPPDAMVGDVHDGLSVSQMCGIRNRVAVSESAECRALPVLLSGVRHGAAYS